MPNTLSRPPNSGIGAPDQSPMHALATRGTVPAGLSGTFIGIGSDPDIPTASVDEVGAHDGVVHSVRLDSDGTISYRSRWVITDAVAKRLGVNQSPGPRNSGPDVVASSIIAFGGSILAFGDGSLAYELTADLETLRRVDLAGHARGLVGFPKRDPIGGNLHVLAVSASGEQAHVVISAGALTRASRPVTGAPTWISDLAFSRDRLVFLADGFVGVARRDGDEHIAWIPTGRGAPYPVHAQDDRDDIVLHCITPSLERWTLSATPQTMHAEVLDGTARRFARTNGHSIDMVPSVLWTIGDGTLRKHDLLTTGQVERSFGNAQPGDLVFVADPARPDEADGGWLVGFVHHPAGPRTDLVVLDAADITSPPVASCRIPRQIPRGLHSTWIPSTDQ